MKKILLLSLLLLLVLFHYQIWFGKNGLKRTIHLRQVVSAQQKINDTVAQRNHNLALDVASLKKDPVVMEEHAREDLGMVKNGETFYEVTPDNNKVSGFDKTKSS